MSPALVNIASSFSPLPHQEGRHRLYRLRRAAGRALWNRNYAKQERVCHCGQKAMQGHVDVRCGDKASYAGIETCGSVWLCPACASKIAEGRRQEVRALAEAHCRAGGEIYMAAFTLRHHRWQKASELRDAVTSSWSKMLAGKPWQRARDKVGCVGGVRALEVTHGSNGWHPHLHVVFFIEGVKPPAEGAVMLPQMVAAMHAEKQNAIDEFGIWLFERWSKIVHRAGYGWCEPSIWKFERAAQYDAVTDYVVKGNFDMELTRGHMKLAKGGGRSPWQLLADYDAGDANAGRLFQDFAAAFKGARQLTYFGDLREAHSDLELAAKAEPGELIGTLPAKLFVAVARAGKASSLLDAAEADGWSGVTQFLIRENLWRPRL